MTHPETSAPTSALIQPALLPMTPSGRRTLRPELAPRRLASPRRPRVDTLEAFDRASAPCPAGWSVQHWPSGWTCTLPPLSEDPTVKRMEGLNVHTHASAPLTAAQRGALEVLRGTLAALTLPGDALTMVHGPWLMCDDVSMFTVYALRPDCPELVGVDVMLPNDDVHELDEVGLSLCLRLPMDQSPQARAEALQRYMLAELDLLLGDPAP